MDFIVVQCMLFPMQFEVNAKQGKKDLSFRPNTVMIVTEKGLVVPLFLCRIHWSPPLYAKIFKRTLSWVRPRDWQMGRDYQDNDQNSSLCTHVHTYMQTHLGTHTNTQTHIHKLSHTHKHIKENGYTYALFLQCLSETTGKEDIIPWTFKSSP